MKISKNLFRWLIMGLLPIFLILAAGIAVAEEEVEEPEPVGEGEIPPDFAAEDIDGDEFVLADYIGEKPVIIDFFATWCGPCRLEMPLLNEFNEKWSDEVELVAISSESYDDKDALEIIFDFREENELEFRFIHNPDRDITGEYRFRYIPFLVVIGVDGTIVSTYTGYHETIIEDLEADLGLTDEADIELTEEADVEDTEVTKED